MINNHLCTYVLYVPSKGIRGCRWQNCCYELTTELAAGFLELHPRARTSGPHCTAVDPQDVYTCDSRLSHTCAHQCNMYIAFNIHRYALQGTGPHSGEDRTAWSRDPCLCIVQ